MGDTKDKEITLVLHANKPLSYDDILSHVGLCWTFIFQIILNGLYFVVQGGIMTALSLATILIVEELELPKAYQSYILSMLFFGMATGAMVSANVGERFGKRATFNASMILSTGSFLS